METSPEPTTAAAITLPDEVKIQPRRIVLRAPATVRAYVDHLAARLARDGHSVHVRAVAADPLPANVDWLLYVERLSKRSGGSAFGAATASRIAATGEADVVVDLVGDASDTDTPTLRLLFAGGAGETGLVDALLAMRSPELTLAATQRNARPALLRRACLAVEQPHDFGAALDAITARLATLIADAVARLPGVPMDNDGLPSPMRTMDASPPAFFATALRKRIALRLDRLVRRVDCWRVATRIVPDGRGVLDRLDWSGPGWRLLPDDAKRYYADPFLIAHEGHRWLFCEEYPHATAKGILSVAPVAPDGTVATPRPFLETASHLSWPQVFIHAGQIYMLPETAAAGQVELWRAVEFPYRWEIDRVLIPDLRAHDPLLHLTSDGAFLLATVDGDGGSSWDALALFSAPDLFGPWQAHPHNPLLIDASAARAAGPLVRRGGELWRATQDCRASYGAGMALCRVTQLDRDGFTQEIVTRLPPPPGSGALGAHTLSQLGPLEAIDIRAPARSFGRA